VKFGRFYRTGLFNIDQSQFSDPCRVPLLRSYKVSGADATTRAEFGAWRGAAAVGEESCGDTHVDRGRGWGGLVDNFHGECGPALCERDSDGRERWRGAMLDGKRQIIAIATQIKVEVAPGLELG
jgi:hypothetical protein